jgi:hypothetical protein
MMTQLATYGLYHPIAGAVSSGREKETKTFL